jgi:hypothetical protein
MSMRIVAFSERGAVLFAAKRIGMQAMAGADRVSACEVSFH